MANWNTNTKHSASSINNGNRYEIQDRVTLEQLNAITENSFYASEKVDTVISDAQDVVTQGKTEIENTTSQGKNELNAIVDDAEDLVVKANASIDTVVGTANEALFTVQQVVASKGYYGSNPNLLINGDFKVNQRGEPSYVAQGWRDTYSVDRWALRGSTGTITLDVATKTLTGAGWLVQEIEDYKSLIGKTLTLSMPIIQKSSSGSINSHLSFRVYYTDGTYTNVFDVGYGTYSGFMSHTFVLNVDETKTIRNVITLYYQGADAVTEVDYVKLEIGSVATAFSPRPYAEELAMCQRYYQNIYASDSLYVVRVTSQVRATKRINMRILPTITAIAPLKVFEVASGLNVEQSELNASIFAGLSSANSIYYQFANFTGLTNGNVCLSDSSLRVAALDAEIIY